MGKGQAVAEAYMGIREGEPQPMMAMKVGVGRFRRESGVMEEVRVRRYSWQYCSDYYH
jgi:hypothetical protein